MCEVEVALDNRNDTFGLHDWCTGSMQLSSECDVDTWLSDQTDLDGNPLFVSRAYYRCADWFLEEEHLQHYFHLAGLQGCW